MPFVSGIINGILKVKSSGYLKGEKVGKIIGIILGGVAIFNGFAILGSDNCQSVSFDGQGSRVAVAQCFADSSGVIPAWLAGIGMIIVGGVIGLIAIKN